MTDDIQFLDFEQQVMAVATRIRELADYAAQGRDDLPEKDLPGEIARLEIKKARLLRVIYRDLTPVQKVQVARHPQRPHVRDYIENLMTGFSPLAGDRSFADDPAVVAGLARFRGRPVAILGTEKGKGAADRMVYNFGMPKPEGYRKAKRVMELANRFDLPLLTFIDTPGAFPGVEAEARGQGEAIASCIEQLMAVNNPVIATITGEGGSGGALALGVGNEVLMLEHSIYSVISPEGCAAILWGQATKETTPQAANALKLTAPDLLKLKVIDEMIKEPVGGAHRDVALTFERVADQLNISLNRLQGSTKLRDERRDKFLALSRKAG